jgi:hypothetical protein
MLLPKAITYYRSLRAAPTYGRSVRPAPRAVSRALLILFVTGVAFLLTSLPLASPENIFSLTQSRLQIPIDVLFTRLSALRPHGLTPADLLLRTKIESRDSRLLYFQYGPDVLTNCQFCSADEPRSYFYYALPALLAPHLFNLCVLALVTSGLFTGREGAVWRSTATIAAAAVALLDLYAVGSYAYHANGMATRLQDIDMFFWRMRAYRGTLLAALDGIIGYLLYLSSTNRAFLNPPSTAERVETSTRILDAARSKVMALSVLRNTINRDEELRTLGRAYWLNYGRLMSEAMEEREVIEGVNNALENRINVTTISADADRYIQAILDPLTPVPGMNGNVEM